MKRSQAWLKVWWRATLLQRALDETPEVELAQRAVAMAMQEQPLPGPEEMAEMEWRDPEAMKVLVAGIDRAIDRIRAEMKPNMARLAISLSANDPDQAMQSVRLAISEY